MNFLLCLDIPAHRVTLWPDDLKAAEWVAAEPRAGDIVISILNRHGKLSISIESLLFLAKEVEAEFRRAFPDQEFTVRFH